MSLGSMKAKQAESEQDEESTTVSMSSSITSISPDNPIYRAPDTTAKTSSGSRGPQELSQGIGSMEDTSATTAEVPGKHHTQTIPQTSLEEMTLEQAGMASLEEKATTSLLPVSGEAKSSVVSSLSQQVAALAIDTPFGERTSRTPTMRLQNNRKDSPPMVDDQPLDLEETQPGMNHASSDESLLGRQLHHDRRPTTIFEDPTMILDKEEEEEPQRIEEHPLLSSKKSVSMENLSGLKPSFGSMKRTSQSDHPFRPLYSSTLWLERISQRLLSKHYSRAAAATWIGFWALFLVTCSNYVLTPIRDAIALQVGVEHMPKLTLASTVLAFCSSVPIGWLFEAPDPNRRRLWKRMGLTRGETQGTSLALFYRCFAMILISYAIGFQGIEFLGGLSAPKETTETWLGFTGLFAMAGQGLYIAFFLVVHLMKLHSLSLVWGVTTEAMEYEEVAHKRNQMETGSSKNRLQRLSLVGFGGTLGGILGSVLTSSMARLLRLPGLLVLASILLEVSAELSTELGRIMQKHWEEQQLFQSNNDLTSLDSSMKRSASMGSMKRVSSGNSLNRVKSTPDMAGSASKSKGGDVPTNDDSFRQRLLRGVSTILRSRLLMAIFTFNALYASTTVLLSFQRAELVANRKESTSTEADTAFLANVSLASSLAIFALQASGLGAHLAHFLGPRGTLTLMPAIRLLGVLALAWWHHVSNGKPPNLLVFLVVDECTKIVNLAVAKPVRESLWRGLSNEARYEAKPIVDTLANRWGGGSAAFLVSFLNRVLDLFGIEGGNESSRSVLGLPPVLFLCMIIAAWWTAVSADLGNIRRNIDIELKKEQ